MNWSKSNGVDSPLCSPAMSAWRNARKRVSRSSSNRNAVRTTSLAERYRPAAISSSMKAL